MLDSTIDLFESAHRQLFRNPSLILGFTLVALLIFTALFANWIAPYSYIEPTYADAGQFPSREHLMGTDTLGRDVFSRVVFGARVSLGVGIGTQIISLFIGVPLGTVSGFLGGKVDYVVTRILDIAQAFPYLLLVIFIMVTIGSGIQNVFIVLALTSWFDICRLTRSQVLSLKEKDFTLAAHALGASNFRVVWRHILPNAITTLTVAATLGIPRAIFAEANLSFIGVGVNPPMPSWGQMVGENYRYIQSYWHLSLFPALMIGVTTISFMLIGDGINNVFDPFRSK